MSTFDRACTILLGYEGSFSCEREDPGNWTGGAVGAGLLKGTKFGISAAAYPGLDIASLTKATRPRDLPARLLGLRARGRSATSLGPGRI